MWPCKPAYSVSRPIVMRLLYGRYLESPNFFRGYHYFQTGCGAHPASYPIGTKGSFTQGKEAEAQFEAFPYIFRDAVRT